MNAISSHKHNAHEKLVHYNSKYMSIIYSSGGGASINKSNFLKAEDQKLYLAAWVPYIVVYAQDKCYLHQMQILTNTLII